MKAILGKRKTISSELMSISYTINSASLV